jgi:putative spermidine/putrescine transport system substrate-binding protein
MPVFKSSIVDRRTLLKGGASALAAPAILIPGRARGATRLVVGNSGGAMGDAKQRAIYAPFTQETGIEILTTPAPDISKIRAQVRTGDVEIDVTDLLDQWVPAAARLGLVERIDESIVNREGCIPETRHDYAVSGSIYAGGIAFPTNRFDGKVPRNWKEFWDVKAIPGRRSLRNRIGDILEIALMADGVPAHEVYPCDVDRAFKALDRIKPHVAQWIGPTEQTVALIQRNETDFTYTYTIRVKTQQEAGVPIDYSFQQNIMGVGWAGIVKGSKRKDAAMQLCAYICRPDVQVRLSNLATTAPCYVDALAKVDPAVRKWMPDLSDRSHLFIDPAWWDPRVDELTQRFREWLLT